MDSYLEHYGRKGMKWYQHIYGTEDSRAKYSKGNRSKRRTKRPMTREEILRNPQALYKHQNEFTTKEIQDALTRFRALNDLQTIAEGEKAVTNIFDMMDGIGKKTSKTITVYNNFANIWNTFKPKDKPPLKLIPTGNKNNQNNQDSDDENKKNTKKKDTKKK